MPIRLLASSPKECHLVLLAVAVLLFPHAGAWAEPIVPPGATARPLELVAFTEGPAWHPSGNVFFSDVTNNRIMRLDPKGKLHVYRFPSGRANGLLFDHQGRLVACEGGWEGGNRRVTRTEPDGTITVLASHYQGKRLNSPNDLTIDRRGRIYFTDPRYGPRDDLEMTDSQGRIVEGVYRIDPDGTLTRIIAHEVVRPNGIAVSPDQRWLYVVDNDNLTLQGNRKIWRFRLREDGSVDLKSQKAIFDFSPGRGGDGMAVDTQGRLYVAAGTILPTKTTTTKYRAGIYILSPEGKQLGFIRVPEDMVTNCCFGGPDRRTLYITAGHKLWSIRVNATGYIPGASDKPRRLGF